MNLREMWLKIKEMATKAGQAVQAYSIQARLTPEGMIKYAEGELAEAYKKFSKKQNTRMIDKHKRILS